MQNHSPLYRRAGLVAWAVSLACLGLAPLGTAAAAQVDVTPSPNQTNAPELATGLGEVAPGLWVFLDPETGRITDRPSPEQLAAIRAQVAQLVVESTAGLVGRSYPNGMKSLDLQGRFQSVSVLTLGPSGSRKTTCAESVEQTVGALLSAPRRIPTLNGLETE